VQNQSWFADREPKRSLVMNCVLRVARAIKRPARLRQGMDIF